MKSSDGAVLLIAVSDFAVKYQGNRVKGRPGALPLDPAKGGALRTHSF